MSGSLGRVNRVAPVRRFRYAACAPSTVCTVSRTTVEVQIRASQGCTGAVNNSAMQSMTRADAVVCVMPHRLQDADP